MRELCVLLSSSSIGFWQSLGYMLLRCLISLAVINWNIMNFDALKTQYNILSMDFICSLRLPSMTCHPIICVDPNNKSLITKNIFLLFGHFQQYNFSYIFTFSSFFYFFTFFYFFHFLFTFVYFWAFLTMFSFLIV